MLTNATVTSHLPLLKGSLWFVCRSHKAYLNFLIRYAQWWMAAPYGVLVEAELLCTCVFFQYVESESNIVGSEKETFRLA